VALEQDPSAHSVAALGSPCKLLITQHLRVFSSVSA
jgi:hypothetical protein